MLYVQYGCGPSALTEWENFDASPSLLFQKIPIIGKLLENKLDIIFASNVHYGNIIAGLPVKDNPCDGIYCSHVLEHLSLHDFRLALKNTYKILKCGGIFRCVVPDLETAARNYLNALDNGDANASINFIGHVTSLGLNSRPKGLKNVMSFLWGNSRHLWMWDKNSLSMESKIAGFVNIRQCKFNDSEDKMFEHVENQGRFTNAIALECNKRAE
ncbi:MAG: methyltransferase domain-containing protein [Bacteroidales bacterium]|jgi:SAM-dependent methyltransferase|nr:methyltransferase domain-containing protein [Bacteroidales bacterium]